MQIRVMFAYVAIGGNICLCSHPSEIDNLYNYF